jgi:hypothetical protein
LDKGERRRHIKLRVKSDQVRKHNGGRAGFSLRTVHENVVSSHPRCVNKLEHREELVLDNGLSL